MTPERTSLCYTIAVVTALATAVGAQLLAGIVGGDVPGALRRELVDLGTYWLGALPVCYLAAGVLGYLQPVRTWRWIVTMIAIQVLYVTVTAGSGLSLLPFAIVIIATIALPGVATGWAGGLIRRHRDAAAHG
jgi:hypothetical protein